MGPGGLGHHAIPELTSHSPTAAVPLGNCLFVCLFATWGNRLILFALLLQFPCPGLSCFNTTAEEKHRGAASATDPQPVLGPPGIFTCAHTQTSCSTCSSPPALMQIAGQIFAGKCHILSVCLPRKNFQRDASNRKQREKPQRASHRAGTHFLQFPEVILLITYS